MTTPRPDQPRICAHCGERPVWSDESRVRLCHVCRDRHEIPVDEVLYPGDVIEPPAETPEETAG